MTTVIPRAFNYLERNLLDEDYFPRKKPNQLCLVIDLNSDLIYPVPVRIEHIDYAALILNNDVKTSPNTASRLIPSNIIVSPDRSNVEKVITGVSGMESGYGVRHKNQDLDLAHGKCLSFIDGGELSSNGFLIEEIVRRYIL